MGWGGPEPLGGKVAFFPSAASWGAGRLDVFGIDLESDALGHWWWDGEADSAWHGPELLSTTGAQGNQLRLIDGGPSAVSWGSHRLDVFCHDANSDRVQHWWWPTHAGWGGPEPLGGQGISEPQAVSLKPGRLDVVGSGQATGVQHWWWDGHWGGPELLAADPIWHPTAPTATWRPSGHLEVFASPAEAGLLHWWWDGQWEGPQYLRNEVDDNPPPNAAPSRAIAWQPDHVDVFTTDGWARLQHWWWNPALRWDGPESSAVGSATGSRPSAVSWGLGRLDVFAVDARTAALQHWWWPAAGGGWHGPEILGGAIDGAVDAVAWGPNRLDVFGIDAETRQLQHWWWPSD